MIREPVSEHYSSGPLGPRVSAGVAQIVGAQADR
jgi:hypothetical protein